MPPKTAMLVRRPGMPEIMRLGLKRRPLGDLYHFFLKCSWKVLIGCILGAYLLVNLVFACLYLLLGAQGILNAHPGSFADAFFFSVQTFATIGYGNLLPASTMSNILVTMEAMTGLLAVAMSTGLIFAKFSRPTARVLFSRVAVISQYEGFPALMFRMANERANQIVEAQLHVTLVRNERTKEGQPVRRMRDLELIRSSSVLFALTWTALHRIDEKSPLFGWTTEALEESGAELVVSLIGYDETFSQTVHARHSYLPEEILADTKFVDILSSAPDGRRVVDYTRFHDVES